MSNGTYVVTLSNGTTEKRWGQLRIFEGVLFIEIRSDYGGYVQEQHAYPLTSVLKWERVNA